MKIVKQSFVIENITSEPLQLIESAGRVCHKSENKIDEDSAAPFCDMILNDYKHESVIEHSSMTVRFICDRGVSHELVRHRLAAFSQESTRYCNYNKKKFGKEITIIQPPFKDESNVNYWKAAMQHAEDMYFGLLEFGESPQIARSVLPTCLKTEIVMTANFREWRHVFKMRCAKAAHPQIRELMMGLLKEVHNKVPVIFDDLYKQFLCEKWEVTPLLKKLEGKEAKKVAVLIESKPVDLPDMPKAPPIELIKENGKKINDVFQICTNRKTKLHSIRKNGYLFWTGFGTNQWREEECDHIYKIWETKDLDHAKKYLNILNGINAKN